MLSESLETQVLSKALPLKGKIHSLESCGTVDGPGIRFVIFTQGCPLSCLYCHNPDCQERQSENEMTADEVLDEVVKYEKIMKRSKGGLTLSGGEPLLQPKFATELFRLAKEKGIHTALDTSGYCGLAEADAVLDYTDLVLLDIKAFNEELYKKVAGVSLAPTLRFAEHLAQRGQATWLRFVLVPGLTDDFEMIEHLADYAKELGNIEMVEVQPFHKLGEYKWAELGMDYQLSETPACSPDLAEAVHQIFQARGLKTI